VQAPLGARHRKPFWAFVVVGVAVAAVIVVGLGPPGILLPRSTVCQLGPRVGTYMIWTPDQPLNKPAGVNISAFAIFRGWNFTFASGSVSVGGIRPNESEGFGWGDYSAYGGISMMGSENNWSFYSVSNTTVIGGSSNPCTQPYVASIGQAYQSCGGLVTIPLQNNVSDALEPHVWNGLWGPNSSFSEPPTCPAATPGAYIWFDTSYHQNATGTSAPFDWDLCNDTGSVPTYVSGVAEVPIVVYAPLNGRVISASGYETWIGSDRGSLYPPINRIWTAFYEVPTGWDWHLAPVGPTTFPLDPSEPLPALVAFERTAC